MTERALPDLVGRARLDTSGLKRSASDAKSEIAGIGKAGEGSSKVLEGSFTKSTSFLQGRFGALRETVTGHLKGIGAGIGAVGVGLTALSQPAQRAERVLTQTIKNTGHSFEQFEDQVDKAIASQVRFGNNSAEVRTALTNLTLKLHDPQKALDNLGLATDIASFKQISLAEASNLVASALNGNGRAFKQFGITLDSSKPKAEAVAEAMEKLRASVRGMAEGEADTAVGKLEAVRTKLENIAAAVGQRAGPAIAGLGAALTTVGGAADGIESIGNIVEKLPGKTEGIAKGIGAIGIAGAGVYVAVKALGALDEALERGRRGSQDIGAVSAELVKLARGASDLNAVLKSGRVGGGVDSLVSDLKKLRDPANAADLATLSANFKHQVDDIDKGLAALVANNHAGQAAAAFKILNESLKLPPEDKKKFFNDYTTAVANSGHAAVVAAADTDTHTSALERNADALKKTAEAVDRMLTAQLAAISSTLGMESATDRVTDSQQDVAEKTKAATEAIRLHGTKSAEAKVAAEALSDAQRDLKDSAVGAAGAAVRLAQDQAAASGKSLTAAESNGIFKTKLLELAAAIGGPIGQALRDLATGIHNVPGQKDIQFNMPGLEAAIANVNRLNAAIDRAAKRGTTITAHPTGPQAPQRAGGGPVIKGRPYVVGDKYGLKYAELFVPDMSGTILPNVPAGWDGASATSSSLGPPVVYELNIYAGYGADGPTIARHLVGVLTDHQDGGGSVPWVAKAGGR